MDHGTGMTMNKRYIIRETPLWLRLLLKRVSRADVDIIDAKSISEEALDELFALFQTQYEGTSREKFAKDFREKSSVAVLRDRRDNRLVGFCTFVDFTVPIELDGKVQDVGVMFVGDTVKAREYWGERGIQLAIMYIALEASLRHSPRPFVWWHLTKGFRSFLGVAPNLGITYPNPFSATPPFYAAVLNAVGAHRYPEQWNAERGVVEVSDYHVAKSIQEPPPHLRGNPWLEFYLERNPGHTVGHELAGVALLTPREIALTSARLVARQLTLPLRKTSIGRAADRAVNHALDALRKRGDGL
jgi:hypothetical protein